MNSVTEALHYTEHWEHKGLWAAVSDQYDSPVNNSVLKESILLQSQIADDTFDRNTEPEDISIGGPMGRGILTGFSLH